RWTQINTDDLVFCRVVRPFHGFARLVRSLADRFVLFRNLCVLCGYITRHEIICVYLCPSVAHFFRVSLVRARPGGVERRERILGVDTPRPARRAKKCGATRALSASSSTLPRRPGDGVQKNIVHPRPLASRIRKAGENLRGKFDS